ncbi:NADH dehydrogenase subunit K [Geoalkalibacter ferrihydriticus]|uniref:NADH-quinone oxidoreductase subunit K n=2 Tax=Geoalkalibacter ferrihydriticus TaxID=392333 RepID=A0A0C2HTJ9_9BACT|nr:NADH-quinone oxidoreductase subunit NuoK [Geoalkalibacter ferrihydriticus]KIH76137.1 NADH-quinone oxidoreductase subunit K [Geoalkalibacter ferrihydriticus DSM 17813]SDM43338.1 NADH dehydrogenase subunit K [Geoalkalibacter ferrihydriticus]
MIVPMSHILAISAVMFVMGLACVLAQRNLIMILIGFEIMLNAVGLTLVGASALWQKVDGQIFVIFLMAVTSAEVAISLALVVYLRRRKATLEADAFSGMKG